MTRLLFPDEASRLVYRIGSGGQMLGAAGQPVTLYSDPAGTTFADLRAYDGSATPGAAILNGLVITDGFALLPMFWGPDGVDTVYANPPAGSSLVPVYARTDDRLDTLAGRLTAVEGTASGLGTAAATLVVDNGDGTVSFYTSPPPRALIVDLGDGTLLIATTDYSVVPAVNNGDGTITFPTTVPPLVLVVDNGDGTLSLSLAA